MEKISIEKNQAGQRFDKFLHKYLPAAGNSFLYKMLRKKNITLNGKKAEGKEILSAGDEVCLFFSQETLDKFKANESTDNPQNTGKENPYLKAYEMVKNVQILYEDEDVLIANKPVGVLSQKAEPKDVSLNEWVLGYCLTKGIYTMDDFKLFKPSVCNRLDRNTSGIVLCGLSLPGSQGLNALIKNRTVDKLYRAIVIGLLKDSFKLDGYLTKDEKSNKVKYDKNQGDTYIRTDLVPIQPGKELSLVEAKLITGKTHQIRAHLASVGNPILGDEKYGNRGQNLRFKDRYKGLFCQQLHAYRIVFPKECTELPQLSGREFTAPYPELFQKICEDIK